MDPTRFDMLARLLTAGPSRRRLLGLVPASLVACLPFGLGESFSLFGLADVDAKRKKKKKKRKRNRKDRKPAPTCSDGIQNGNETGVDCGGDCPRCADGQGCATRDDCASARCDGGTCLGCTSNLDCGTDAGGSLCLCGKIDELAQQVCLHAEPQGPWVADCAECPPGTICNASNPGVFDCLQLCGTVEE
jgi:hypothetical protein